MNFPSPTPGLVIRYGFLWSHEAELGAIETAKDRPCAIVVAMRKTGADETRVIVAPITHAPPENEGASIEIPNKTARALGLDDSPHWLRADELNSFVWPGFDLRPISGGRNSYAYGMLPQALYEELKEAILIVRREGQAKVVAERD